MITVYTLRASRKGAVRYIGITKAPMRRLVSHISKAKGAATAKDRWILKVLRSGGAPVLSVVCRVQSRSTALQKEDALIKSMAGKGAKLFNVKGHPYVRHPMPAQDGEPVSVRVDAAFVARLDAYAAHVERETGLRPKRGPLLLALARKGMQALGLTEARA